jgi:uncharacterized protein
VGIVTGILEASYDLFRRMAPFLLFGYFFAGMLHVFLKKGAILSHLGKNDLKSVIKASLFGVPLPLCSCAVIPAAMSLRKEGASKGAVLSFLISTPTSGVDSIFATYSLLGAFFAVYRVIASFIAGIFSGTLANLFLKKDEPGQLSADVKCGECESDIEKKIGKSVAERIKEVFRYAYVDLLKDTGPPLLLGILLGGTISFLMPKELVETHLGSGILPMVVMLVAGLPMYVCATASIPIAAALMAKGLAPGAAFVFLVAGPATNIVTMSVVAKSMGKKALAIYLISIIFCAVSMGAGLDMFWEHSGVSEAFFHPHHAAGSSPGWVGSAAGLVLFVLIAKDIMARLLLVLRRFLTP